MAAKIIVPTEEVELKPGARFLMGNAGTWWRVLDVNTDAMTALVIADREVCEKKYHEPGGDITWENCTLRAWLNGEYLQKTFSAEERDAIIESHVSNSDNPEYHTPGGNDTTDRIFLLSLDEVRKYFENDADRATGMWWWLRSPGRDRRGSGAAGVCRNGGVRGDGYDVIVREAVSAGFQNQSEIQILPISDHFQ